MEIAEFRTANVVFTSVTSWPDPVVQEALNEAEAETGGKGWGSFENLATNFKYRGLVTYASHYLVSMYPSGASVAENANTGSSSQVTAKSVGDESISYAQADLTKLSAGDEWFLSTVYGQKFLRLRKRAGMGALAI